MFLFCAWWIKAIVCFGVLRHFLPDHSPNATSSCRKLRIVLTSTTFSNRLKASGNLSNFNSHTPFFKARVIENMCQRLGNCRLFVTAQKSNDSLMWTTQLTTCAQSSFSTTDSPMEKVVTQIFCLKQDGQIFLPWSSTEAPRSV
jgi:hypothetical protein